MAQTLRYAFAENPSLVPDTESPGTTPDLSITRTTSATMVDADGYIRGVQNGEARFDGATWQENSIRQSVDLNTTWGLTTVTATGGQADPFGGTDAFLLTCSPGPANARVNQSVTPTFGNIKEVSSYFWSVYAKAGNVDWIQVSVTGGGPVWSAFFDLTNGAVGATVGAGNDDEGIIDIGGGWYRCWIKFTTNTDTSLSPTFYISDGDNDITTADGSTIIVVAPQLELVGTKTLPGTYVPTTTTAAVSSLTGTSNGLLVEEARTNICLQSEDFSTTWVLNGNASVNTNQTTAPDGSTTADQLIDDAGTGTGLVDARIPVTVATGTVYTYSVFIKQDQLSWAYLRTNALSIDGESFFDVGNGVVGTKSANHNSSGIEDYGNGWYRCWITFTSDSVDTSGNVTLGPADADADNTVDLDGTSSIFVWGAQLEAGSFPTSYIPTTTASVTRNGDYVLGTGVSGLTTNAGSIYINATKALGSLGGNEYLFRIDDGTNTNRIYFFMNSTAGNIRIASITTAADEIALNNNNNDPTPGTPFRYVLGYAEDDVIGYMDGAVDATDPGYDAPNNAFSRVIVGNAAGGTFEWNGIISEIRYYNERLDNTGLENLSNGLFPIPDVVDFTSAGATTLLEANGFVADTTTTAYSDTIAVGNVIEQTAAAGTYAANGTTVVLTISLGADPNAGNPGGWLNEYNAYKQRKAAQERHRKEVLKAVRELDGIDGEIAELMQLDQAKEDEQKRIAEFRAMLDKEISKAKLDKAGLLNKRINRAYDRAMQKATYSAIEALEREIEQAIEEEEFLFIVMSIQ